MLPSPPSVPSSSTPFPGLVQSSPASQSATTPVEKYGCEPTPMEVFTYTHTKDHDGNMFINRHALGINENCSTAREHVVSSQAEAEAKLRVDELALYLEAVGGKKKRKVYGIGSQASQFYCDSASYASTATSGPQPDHSAEEITALRARVDEQERQLAELKAHVMQMSVTLVLVLLPLIFRLLQIEMFLQLCISHYRLLSISLRQTIPWSLLPTLPHIQ
ncbi:hypothetical protein JCGZ_23718 [Jatropha curcas]|uniref:Uncharacterized protein n=1 Tax=Jatropha curcas TaxID=180498 RepID=A0A067JSJ2_JATCU|nr:hypothetical protein JCGZ_23718 [Jatropha curcas]